MRIFDRARVAALAVALAAAASLSAMAGKALPVLPEGDTSVVNAAATGGDLDAAATTLDAIPSIGPAIGPTLGADGTDAAMTPELSNEFSSRLTGNPDHPRVWFERGLQAYNAGDGRLAVENWRMAAENDNLPAQWNLSILYRRGTLIAPDIAESVRYLRTVASRHDPNRRPGAEAAMTIAALVELADIYRTGEPAADIAANPERAVRMYKIAATLYGDARAQHRLGLMYLSGEGVPHHAGQAIRWLALSAKKRYVPSFAALGDFYWEHRGEGNNKVRGLMWLSLAKENVKHDDLRDIVTDRYNAALTEANEEERQKAIALIQTWNGAAQ